MAFQSNAFQHNAFQIPSGAVVVIARDTSGGSGRKKFLKDYYSQPLKPKKIYDLKELKEVIEFPAEIKRAPHVSLLEVAEPIIDDNLLRILLLTIH